MAEFIMKYLAQTEGLADKLSISSAAVSYEEEGNSLYPPAANMLRLKGIPYSGHVAHRITSEEASAADLLIIMDHSNENLLKRIIRPEDFGKVHYMLEYAGRPGRDVADPWYTGNFDRTFADLYSGCSGLLDLIRQGRPLGDC